MARSVSRVRDATAIIMSYDIESRIARAAAPASTEVGHVQEPISSLVGDCINPPASPEYTR